MLTEAKEGNTLSRTEPSLLKRALKIEWLGQMMASIFWIASVFTYGISEKGNDAIGDWLQLFAASAWFIANIASLLSSNEG